ncbi:MAG: M18 family aminopeptidase [Clostridia bacterium]|nr:M18 family aminopeptidase [Clostridia bacterium]
MEKLLDFLSTSLTAYNACENIRAVLSENGFKRLKETEEWELCEGGKYFVERGGGCLVAFVVGDLDSFSYKIAASHLDSPALKLKENPVEKKGVVATLNTEPYGGGVWYSFFDRPLRIAGRVVKSENNRVRAETVVSPYLVTIPSLAAHQNRGVNDGFAVNPQIDLQPVLGFADGETDWLERLSGEGKVLSYDLYLVNAQAPYFFGVNDEFLASPRIDNLTSAYASLEGLLSAAESDGVCVAAFMNAEEIGNRTAQGADGDFLENALRRIAYALRFDDNEYYKALASSFLLSVDNAHATHPNHPEKSDTTNKAALGGGVVIKSHAGGAYITDAISSVVVKTLLDKAGVKRQSFFNRSDVRSGSTLGASAVTRFGMAGADIGIAQLAMHSACECFAKSDYTELVNALTAFYSSDFLVEEDGYIIR